MTGQTMPHYKIARVYSGVDPVKGPHLSNRPVVHDSEREDLVSYLDGGALLLRTDARTPDRVSGCCVKAVPCSLRTDGRWIWSEAVTYYLDTYGVAPDEEFLAHLRTHRHEIVMPSTEQVASALSALRPRSTV